MENSGFESSGSFLPPGASVILIPLGQHSNSTRECYKTQFFGKWLFIKALKAPLEADSRYMEAFRKEQEIGLQFDHPNLPKYVFPPEDLLPGRTFVAMEYIDGVPLGEFIEAHRHYFSRAENMERFVREISSALDYLHSHQILHLDLKPDNILVTRVGNNVKIIDFGFSKTDSYTGSAGFTSGYIPPERALSEEKTEAADFYGLGKLMEYIRLHTPDYPVKKFRKLEARLLASDPHLRIHAKREVDRALTGKSRVSFLHLGLILIGVLSVVAGFILMRQREARVEDGNKAELIIEEGSEASEEAGVPDVILANTSSRTEDVFLEVPPAPRQSVPAEKQDKAGIDALQQSVDHAIRMHLAPLSKDIRAALDSNDFSIPTYQRLAREVNEGAPFIDSQQFLARYPSFSEDAIFDMIAFRTMELERELWKQPWSEYVKKFMAYQESVK